MNNIFRNVFSFSMLLCLMLVLGCSKYLDKQPDNIITSDMLWQTKANAEAYLNQVYGYIQTSMDDYTMLGASDETSCSVAGVNVRKMIVGNWNPLSGYFYNWGGYYNGIRQSFVFENNVHKVPSTALSDELKQQYRSEVLFLRGWFYWKLLRQYGPFVKLTGTLSLNEDYNKYPRAPFDTCVLYINQLMDQAAQGLPDAWSSTANLGRPTKGACLAVKSQLALLAASPLWNGNPRFANFKNHDGVALAPAQYDANKWKIAADAAKAVIDLNVYKLFTNTDEGDAQFDPYLSCRNVFLTPWNTEMVFSTHKADTWQWGHEKRCAPQPGGYNMENATQNVVDAFYMRNGRTIDDPLSGYIETGFVQVADTAKYGVTRGETDRGFVTGNSNMYAYREPRFYVDIQYNGKPVLPAPTNDDRNFYSSDANKNDKGRAEFYYSGKSGVEKTSNGDITGYSVLKDVSPASNIRVDQAAYRPFIHIRYAEILLNYVEALNEYDPGNPNILTYLNMIRQRAGIPNLETVYPSAAGNQVEMRKWILRERQIELCFESDRYFTLVRRQMMGNPEVKTIYRMNTITKDNGLGFSFQDYYNRTLLQTRYWDDKMYLFPINQDDIDKDNALVQNPGW
jgi:starch-binding outer membrane protein, SusD/RagB family